MSGELSNGLVIYLIGIGHECYTLLVALYLYASVLTMVPSLLCQPPAGDRSLIPCILPLILMCSFVSLEPYVVFGRRRTPGQSGSEVAENHTGGIFPSN